MINTLITIAAPHPLVVPRTLQAAVRLRSSAGTTNTGVLAAIDRVEIVSTSLLIDDGTLRRGRM
jgi:hypothetical protein